MQPPIFEAIYTECKVSHPTGRDKCSRTSGGFTNFLQDIKAEETIGDSSVYTQLEGSDVSDLSRDT